MANLFCVDVLSISGVNFLTGIIAKNLSINEQTETKESEEDIS